MDAKVKTDDTMADDILRGAAAIANFLFGDPGRRGHVYYLCSTGQLPHFRFGPSRRGRIYARKSTLRALPKQREAETIKGLATAPD